MVSCEKSLKSLHTFNLDIQADKIIYASDNAALINAWQQCQQEARPFLLIGGGSNLLFLEDFSGTVVVNQIKGIRIHEVSDHWLIHAGSGENWHQFVQYTLERNIPGLENLALIPGMVGSSPIQNIGAYGVEIRDVCVYVDVLELNSGKITRIPAEACQFGYRESIFKHHYQHGYAITGVGFRLSKTWKPVLNYGNLRSLDHKKVTPRDIFDSVCAMRRSKLPDSAEFGNAGSFFKNPVIFADQARLLQHSYPDIPHYPQADKTVKIAAGWLIEQCQLKGRQSGGAAVYQQQALVLINQHQATSADVVSLASLVRASVGEKFGIWLEPEVRFIGHSGEVNALEVIS